MNSTNVEWVPVEVFTWPTTYEYAMSELLITYGAAFICAFVCSAIGLFAFFFSNGSSYQNLFSTYFRATNDLNLRSQIESVDHGSDPLPEAFAKARVALGEHVDDTGLDSERADLQLLEIARTGIFPRLN
jgi:hypothetical protein